jgi:hypothetical protein
LKKGYLILIALVAFAAFASGAIAQEKKTEPTAPISEKATPAKAKAPKQMKVVGTVGAYEIGQMITVKNAKGKEMTFDVTAKTKMKGEVKQGAKVTILYTKDGEKMMATSISGPKAKKEKTAKKAQ